MISWSDFEKVDIRVGTIEKVAEFPKANKPAWQLTINFGREIGVKKSSAQIVANYDKSDLIGKQVLAVVNFPPKQIANFFSECLVLGVSGENGEIVLLSVDQEVPNGGKVH